jgi:hypothetical protein
MYYFIYFIEKGATMKMRLHYVGTLAIFFCLSKTMTAADLGAQKPWTFLVYMAAANNNLHSSATADLYQMAKVGSNEIINIIVYLTSLDHDGVKVSKKLYIEHGCIVQIGEDLVRDSGDITTLQEALEWACTDYPSEHMAVVLWSTGSGPLNRSNNASFTQEVSRGVCYDDETGHYLMDDDCLEAFSWAIDIFRDGRKFDIIALDASFFASLEMAYTLSFCADYMVASQETTARDSFEYASLLQPFLTHSPEVFSFAQGMITSYKQENKALFRYSLSATDLNQVHGFIENCNQIAQILTMALQGKNKSAAQSGIKKCIKNNIIFFDDGVYMDLYLFYKNMLKNMNHLKLSHSSDLQLRKLLQEGIRWFSKIIVSKTMSNNYLRAGGLSIYFSRHVIDPSYYGLHWTHNNPHWLNFLEAYLS